MLRLQPFRRLSELAEVHAVVVASLLVRLAQLRVREGVELGNHVGQLWIWQLDPPPARVASVTAYRSQPPVVPPTHSLNVLDHCMPVGRA